MSGAVGVWCVYEGCGIELREEMESLEEKMNGELIKSAAELGLEARKTLRLESSTQLGHFFRVTKKVLCVRM